jgi:hypothetical protein
MKRAGVDNNYMIRVFRSCFIDSILDSSESLCQAGLRCFYLGYIPRLDGELIA